MSQFHDSGNCRPDACRHGSAIVHSKSRRCLTAISIRASMFIACALLLQLMSMPSQVLAQQQQTQSRPNIVMILADDQDLLLGSMNYMPKVRSLFGDEGTFFEKHYCTVAQCCPSRVSLLTGKAAHNTNITSVSLPYGGYSRFVAQGLNGQWLPSWIQESGYNTYYVGKLMNNHSVVNYNNPYPKGFNATDFLIDPGTYIYYNATMQSNQDPPRNLPGQYSTDLVASRALQFMKDGSSSSKPFFLVVAPIGPHSQTVFPTTTTGANSIPRFDPPVPANKYASLYPGVKVPRTASYNTMGSNPPSYFKNLIEWNTTIQDYHDEYYRLRLAALASVDDLASAIIDQGEQLGIMDNTYFIYTSDNGYHIGQHRLPAGKECAIEEDINVPFYIRGPGIAKGKVITSPTTHTDITPTIFDLAGIPLRDDFDGVPMPVGQNENNNGSWQGFTKLEHVNVEFWGPVLAEGKYGFPLLSAMNNNTYKSLRLISPDYSLAYVVWCTNERELYDMTVDTAQLDNLAVDFSSSSNQTTTSSPQRSKRVIHGPLTHDEASTTKLQSRLDTLLMVLKTCKAVTCQQPWRVMHPDGSVNSLKDAMNPKYDAYYLAQPKISFSACAPGYIRALEGPGEDMGDIKPYSPPTS